MKRDSTCTLTQILRPEQDQAIFATNVFGTLNVCKAFLPYMRAGTGHRTIANFGSIASWHCEAGSALYSGTKFAVSGISEAMHAELAPLGINVTVVEPGYFRTSVLNTGVIVHSEKQMDCYNETLVGQIRNMLDSVDNKQPGDVVKGCKVIVDILTMEGAAKGRKVPMRIPLGSDAPGYIGGKCKDTLELLKEWDDIIVKTDHED
jgi:NAD(P)-dependent dehydrogenase (short-subunit alcohol dehydrogenase family)